MHATNRREFLKVAGVLGATVAVGTEFATSAEGSGGTGDSWATYRGNAGRTGATENVGPGANVTTERSFDMDGGMYTSEPVVADGTVYMAVTTAHTPSTSAGYVAAYDPDGDETVWKHEGVSRPGTPTVGGGTVYFGTYGSEDADGTRFFALDADTGETKWHKPASDGLSNPLVADGDLYVEMAGGVSRLDAETGDTVWTTDAVQGSACYADRTLFYTDGTALNAADGSVRWDVTEEDDELQAVADGVVYGVVNESSEHAIKARSADDGTVRWSSSVNIEYYWLGDRLTVANGRVFFRVGNTILAFDAKSGEEAWTTVTDAALAGALSVGGETLYAGGRADPETETGNAVVLALNTTSGEVEWRHEFGGWNFDEYGPAANSPVVADGRVYTATYPMGSTLDWMYTRYGDFHVLGSDDGPATTTTTEETTTTAETTTSGKTTTTASETTTTTTTTSGTTMPGTTTTTTTTSGSPGATETTGTGGNGQLTSTTTGTTTTSDGQPGFGLLTALGGVGGVGAYLRSKIERED
ncbi:PQQ-binding-like beta-propeller repeat protein (plasmid) [Haladaptatus sp. SPP-AMP-3]|uniref:outer membrane protein assembly factor BamB family protein n=1 Tax=Haladaptatus sp. SPP-AMP-3 TaxID=3121295 RepID=UPI003C2E8553